MKKLILSSVLVGLVCGLLMLIAAQLYVEGSNTLDMFASGTLLSMIWRLVMIPRKVSKHKPFSKKSFLSLALICGTTGLIILSLGRVWPISGFTIELTPLSLFDWKKFAWLMCGSISASVVIDFLVNRRSSSARAD